MARRRRVYRLRLEPLEPRLALSTVSLSGGVLTITGTDGRDTILVGRVAANRVNVKLDGKDMGGFGPVAHILVNAGDGNDTVLVGPRVTLPSIIHGDAGNDRLRGGAGADQVFGDDGDDALTGSAGRDALDGGQGNNRVSIPHSMGTITVGKSASGEAIRLLKKAYTLQSVGRSSASGPIVVGGADLRDVRMASRLKAAYAAGQPVSLTNANNADIERLRSLIGHEGSVSLPEGVANAALVTFRRSPRPDGRTHFSSDVLLPRQRVAGATGVKAADRNDIEKLSGSLAGTALLPTVADSPQQNLINLADSYQSSYVNSDEYGDQVQLTNSVWAARSFQNQTDLYYVLQEADFHIVSIPHFRLHKWDNSVQSLLPGNTPPMLIQPSPQTTMEATTDTSSVSYTISGSAGWNQKQGLNASVGGSVTVSNSKTTTIPPVDINNNGNLISGQPSWSYGVNELPAEPETVTFFNQWIWEEPFSAYSPAQAAIQFTSEATLTAGFFKPFPPTVIQPKLMVTVNSVVPLPFGQTFTLQPPVITGITAPDTVLGEPVVDEGESFTIQGTGLYPALITGVLIGGVPVDASNITKVSDTEISVVAPDQTDLFPQTVSVQTAQGTSNTNFTIIISDF